jgi:butyryl-CoA dehydrogenase
MRRSPANVRRRTGAGEVDFSLRPEHQALQERARAAAWSIVAPAARMADEQGVFRRDVIEALAAEGFLGMPLPAEYGGGDVDAVGMSLVYEEMGRVDSSVRGFLSVHVGLVSQCIMDWGTEQQRAQYLPGLAAGAVLGCYCLTEAEAGSDAGSLQTRARRDGASWVLNGEKIWITNGNVADLAVMFATVDPALGSKGVTAFLVPTRTSGFSATPLEGTELGHRGSDHARVTLTDVRVGEDSVLGGEGHGFRVAMAALDHGRLGVAAGAVGVLQACLDASVAFARTRRQFGSRIGDFEMIQATLADMAADTAAARLLVRHAAWVRDQGQRNTQEVSIAKLFATEAACRATGEAVLLHGARGYSNEYPVERHYRDIKGLQIYEGTSHIQRIIIARRLLGREDGTGSAGAR